MRFLLLALLLLFSGCTLVTQLLNFKEPPKTIALLIVNEKYSGDRELTSIRKGIEEFKVILKRVGVDEVLPIKYNITYNGLQKAFDELESKIEDKKNTNVFIYFSGHGVMDQSLSKSYVEMIDEHNRTLVNLNVFYDFRKKIDVRATVLAFDACRNKDNSSVNKIEGKLKMIPKETYISYATRNSQTTLGAIPYEGVTFYLKLLSKHIQRRITAKEVFESVGNDLIKIKGHQVSKREDLLNGKDFIFYKNLQDGFLTAG